MVVSHYRVFCRLFGRANDLASLGSDWTDQVLSQLQAAGGFVARLSWGIFLDGTNHPFDSVAVFDSDGNLLFDTVLIRTITAIEAQPDTPKVFLQATANVASTDSESVSGRTDSESVSGRFTVSNFAGSKTLTYSVALKSEVAPYITAATNDAAMTMTASVTTGDAGGTGIWPVADPQVYFGTGGKYAVINSEAAKTPFKSRIWVSPDVFQDGDYRISGNDLGSGVNFDLSFGVSVSVKGGGERLGQGRRRQRGYLHSGSWSVNPGRLE